MTDIKQSNPPKRVVAQTAQKAQAEAIFNSIGDGAIATDEFGRITRVNPAVQRLLGYEDNELLGEWFPKIIVAVSEDDTPIDLIDRPITKAFLTGKSIYEKIYYRTKYNKLLPVSVTVSPIMLEKRPIGAIEVFRDISLEDEVDRMKSEFISLASHQLRTPLSAIKTYSHMLVDGYMGEVSSSQQKSLRTIISAANRMNELISTLLNITRIESGTITITPKRLHIDKVVEEVVKELSLQAADKQIALSLQKIGSAPLIAKTDSLIVKEILTNLVSNAIKYTTEQGSVVIELKARPHDILVSVIDTGWGIPKYSQDQVFSKFFRAHNVLKRETSGTGLGLYLVKGLLERLGGSIWFNSVEGEGTTFFVTLPKQMAAAKQPKETMLKAQRP